MAKSRIEQVRTKLVGVYPNDDLISKIPKINIDSIPGNQQIEYKLNLD